MNHQSLSVSIVLPTLNEKENVIELIGTILSYSAPLNLDVLVVDDNSSDGTQEAVLELSQANKCIRMIERFGRKGLASAIKEGILNCHSDYIVLMDSDGQHKAEAIVQALEKLINEDLDIVIGSRFMKESSINGLSSERTYGSRLANKLARLSLHDKHKCLSDYMSGFFVLNNRPHIIEIVQNIDVKGFKFLYEFLSSGSKIISSGEIPLDFKERQYGESKLNLPIVWDFIISLIYALSLKIIPRRAISFALVGCTGVLIQLVSFHMLGNIIGYNFNGALIVSVFIAAASNFYVNNILTFRFERLCGFDLFRGLLQYLLVISLPIALNISIANIVYTQVTENTISAQLAGIIIAYAWNYIATSKFIWRVAGN